MALTCDLALDAYQSGKKQSGNFGVVVDRVVIDKDGDFARGEYVTVTRAAIYPGCAEEKDYFIRTLAYEIKSVIDGIFPDKNFFALVAGLGNGFTSSDALGKKVVDKIAVTRGAGVDGINEVCAYPLGVAGVTGVDSFEVITALNRQLSPDIIICVDALCAIKRERICRAYQLSSAGIRAGGGTENPSDKKINFKSMGVPVVAIGVPTVISAQLAVKEITGENERADEYFSGGDMFVTLRDIDLAVNECAEVISSSLNLALSPETYFLHNS